MKLKRLTDRVWYYPMEERRDRPVLGYVRGDRWSLAVDAGHSDAHVDDFYQAIEEEGLPKPKLTVLTHWHWDHTFGLHAISGLSLANAKTLIEIPEEGVLFLGDAVCGVFPTWEKDPGLCKKLADTIKNVNVKYCVSGHWEPLSKEETLADLIW